MSAFNKHPKLTLSAVMVIMTAAMLAVFELGARVLIPEWRPTAGPRTMFFADGALLGWTLRPGQTGRFNAVDFSVEVKTNSHRLRDREYPIARSEKKRLLILGDSYGWGYGVEQDEIFSEVLERRHPDVGIINASVTGYGTDQQCLYLKNRGMALRPDVVLVPFCNNAFDNNAHARRYGHNKPRFDLAGDEPVLTNHPVPPSTPWETFRRPVVAKTYFIREVFKGLHLVKQEGFPFVAADRALAEAAAPTRFAHDPHWNANGHRIAARTIERFLQDHAILGRGAEAGPRVTAR